jgi:iron complex transport system ATP-binding protein
MIAKALAQQTPVIYLDEPTAFLDFPSKVEVLLLLRRISQASQKVIFLSTHDVELALQVADRIWLMDKSTRKLFIGTAQELAQDGILSRFIERNGIHFNSDTLTIQIDKTA